MLMFSKIWTVLPHIHYGRVCQSGQGFTHIPHGIPRVDHYLFDLVSYENNAQCHAAYTVYNRIQNPAK